MSEGPERPGAENAGGWRRIQDAEADRVRDAFRGCLLGGAVGDALGAPVEFLRREQIIQRFGPEGVRELEFSYGRAGAITDDTQMSLFTAEGLLAWSLRSRLQGRASLESCLSAAYLRWLGTQGDGLRPACRLVPSARRSWLLEQPELWSPRVPGATCVSALARMPRLGEPARNDSKGCGGVMRIAPVGLFACLVGGPGWAFDAGCRIAGLTHGHPTGRLAAGVLAAVIASLVGGSTLEQALDDATRELREREGHDETLRAVERARALSASPVEPATAVRELGEGWIAEEALAIAVYCALAGGDFATGVRLAVNHDGDSDSTGAVAGNLLGARFGARAIPARWLDALELREVLTEIADDLAAFPAWVVSGAGASEAAHVLRKYPPDV